MTQNDVVQDQEELKRLRREAILAARQAAESLRRPLEGDLTRQAGPDPAAVPPEGAKWLESPRGFGFQPVEMLKNAPGSFIRNAKAVLWDMPKAAVESLAHYATRPGEYARDVGRAFRYSGDIVKIIKDDVADYYDPDHFGSEFTKDPFRVVSDVAGVALPVGGVAAQVGLKGAQALRATAPVAAKVLAKVGKAGRALAKVDLLDPSTIVAGAVAKGARPLADSLGMGKYSRTFKTLDATLSGEADREAFEISERIIAGKLSPEDHDALIRSLAEGEHGFLESLRTTRPDLWAKREKIIAWLDEDSKYYTEAEKLIDSESANDALRKGLVRYQRSRGNKLLDANGAPREWDIADAHKAIFVDKTHDPKYFKIFGEHDRSMFDAFSERLYHGGVLSRAERRALKGEIPKDINQILSHQLRTTIGTKKSVKLARAAQEILAQNGDLKVVTKNMTAADIAKLKKDGYSKFEGPFYQKYHETMGKAANIIAEAAKKPGDVMKNVVSAAEQAKDTLLKAEEMLDNPAVELWAPKHAVQWLNLRLNPGSADSLIGKAIHYGLNLGGTLPYYKAIATVMNPRYWIANAVGDAALSFLYGLNPQALKWANKLRDIVPDEIKNIGINKLYQSDYGLFMRTANRLFTYTQNIDNFFKRAVFIDEAMKQATKAKLIDVGRQFFYSESQIKQVIAQMQYAPNRWIDNLERITKLKEGIAKVATQAAGDKQDIDAMLYKLSLAEGGKSSDSAVGYIPGAQDKYGLGYPRPRQEPLAPVDPAKAVTPEDPNAKFLDATRYSDQMKWTGEPQKGNKINKLRTKLLDEQTRRLQAQADAMWRIKELHQLEALDPVLARDARIADKAIDTTAKFFGSYARLSPFEKKVVRQFIPFYTFTKAMTQLAFRLPFMMPTRQFIYLNLWRVWNDLMDNDGPNNSFFRSVIPVATLANGDIIAIKASSINPFGSVRTTGIAGVEIPSAFDLFGNHPIMRIAMGSRGQMTPKPLEPGTMATRLDNGEVWQYTGQGFKRVLLQPSFAKTLWSLFPQAQIIDSWFLSGAQSGEGFTLSPNTITGPDGKPLYPIGLQEKILSAVVPTTRLNPQKMMQRDLMKLNAIRRSYLSELRRAGSEEKKIIIQIIQEMAKEIRRQHMEY